MKNARVRVALLIGEWSNRRVTGCVLGKRDELAGTFPKDPRGAPMTGAAIGMAPALIPWGETIAALSSGAVSEGQVAAFAMAVFFRGMDDGELAVWADAMLRSGDVLDLSAIRSPLLLFHGDADDASVLAALERLTGG